MARTDRFWGIVEDVIEQATVVVHVMDARLGIWTKSDQIETLCEKHGKPIVYIFNKCDLVSIEGAKYLLVQQPGAILFSSTKHYGTRRLRTAIQIKGSKSKEKTIKVGIVGYPNTGKSSVINALKGRRSAPASSRSGTTINVQNVRISKEIMLIDTPGVIPLDDLPQERAWLIDSKNQDQVKDPIPLAIEIIKLIASMNGKAYIEEILGVAFDEKEDPELFLEELALKRNRVLKGGVPDTMTIAKRIIYDWQKGKLTLLQGKAHAQYEDLP